MTTRRRVIVHGMVQGVGFRVFAAGEARRLGVGGFVRNLPDGTVEAEVEGDEATVERMLDALRSGPPGARVAAVEDADIPPRGDRGFAIARA